MSMLPNSRLVLAMILSSILFPLLSIAQVTIKEKVEIKPRSGDGQVAGAKTNPRLSSGSNTFFNPPLFVKNPRSGEPELTLPASLTFSGSVNVHGALDYNQFAVLLHGGTEIAWMIRHSYGWGGEVAQGQRTETASYAAGHSPSFELWLSWNGGGTCDTSVGSSGVGYNFAYTLCCPPILVTATAFAGGSFLPNVGFDHWKIYDMNITVTGHDSTQIDYNPMDGTRNIYSPMHVSSCDVEITVRVDAKGDYVFLSFEDFDLQHVGSHFVPGRYDSGRELTVPYRKYFQFENSEFAYGMPVHLVYDESKGTFDGETDTVYVTVTGGGKSTTIPVVLSKNPACAQVLFGSPELSPGQTTTLTFKKEDGTDFPAGQEFDVMIVGGGGSSGTLQSLSGSGTVLTKTRAPVSYVAPSAIDSTIIVQVAAFASGSGNGGNATATSEKAVTLLKRAPGQVATQSLSKDAKENAVKERLGKLLAGSTCAPGEVTITEPKVPRRIVLEVMPNQLDNSTSDYAILTVSLKDRQGLEIPSEETNPTISFKLGDEAQGYCGLGSGDGPLTSDESYRDVLRERVMAWRSDKSYDEIFPLRVNVTANALSFSDQGILSVVGPRTTGEYYNQGDPLWANLFYDSSSDSIRKKGCALTAMAMILRAIGVDIDPSGLNGMMTYFDFFDKNHNVDFTAVSYFSTVHPSSSTVLQLKRDGNALHKVRDGLYAGNPIPTAAMTQYLSTGSFVIAEVLNIHNNGTTSPHFVVVTKMIGTNPTTGQAEYAILDPGYSKRTTLNNYSNQIYRTLVFHR